MRTKVLSSVLLALSTAVAPSCCLAQGDTPPGHSGSITELLRYEPTGLSLLSPYARGKIPVLFIHGLWSNPTTCAPRRASSAAYRPGPQAASSTRRPATSPSSPRHAGRST